MADFHAADLWVAVVPETSQVGPAMEAAGKEAKGKFGAAVKDFGKTIHDDLDKISDKAKDSFGKAGKKAGDAFNSEIGKELRNTVNEAIGPSVNNAMDELHKIAVDKAKGVGHDISKSIGDAIGGTWGGIAKDLGDSLVEGGIDVAAGRIRDKLAGVKSAADGVKQSFADLKAGKYEDVLKRIDDNANLLPGPLKEVRDQIKPVSDSFQELKNTGKDVIETFAGLEAISPGLAAGLAKIAAPLGEIAGSMAMVPKVDEWLKSHFKDLPLPDTDSWNWFKQPFREMGGDIMHPSRLGQGGLYDKNGNYIGPGAGTPAPPAGASGLPPALQNMLLPGGPATPGAPAGPARSAPSSNSPWTSSPWFRGAAPAPSLPAPTDMPDGAPSLPSIPAPSSSSGGGAGGSGYSRPSIGSPSTRAGVAAAGSQVANLYAFAQSLVGTPYSQELRNDCSGMVAKLANVAVGLPPAASFSTVNEGQWLMSHGFEPGLGGPNDFNIGWYDHGGGNAGHTAATLPGGIHAESGGSHGSFALGSGAAGAENPEFTQHAHLSMGSLRGGGGAAGQMPTGAEHDPLYVTQTSGGAGGTGGDKSSMQSQGQQLGQGLMNGVLQMFGIDGSVFGGKSPLDWGAVKLGGGLLNYGMGLMNSMSGGGGGPMGTPGLGSGGGGGLGGLAGLIPGPGAAISSAVGPGGGSYGIGQQSGAGQTTIDQSINIHNPSGDPYDWLRESQWGRNAQRDAPRSNGYLSNVPVPQ